MQQRHGLEPDISHRGSSGEHTPMSRYKRSVLAQFTPRSRYTSLASFCPCRPSHCGGRAFSARMRRLRFPPLLNTYFRPLTPSLPAWLPSQEWPVAGRQQLPSGTTPAAEHEHASDVAKAARQRRRPHHSGQDWRSARSLADLWSSRRISTIVRGALNGGAGHIWYGTY